MRLKSLLVTAVLFLFSPWLSAQTPTSQTFDDHPFIDRLSPPMVQAGKKTRVTVYGRRLEGVVGLWSSLSTAEWSAHSLKDGDATEARFDIQVAASVPRGIYGVRIATRDGLSNVHLIVVGDLPTVLEDEGTPSGSASRNDTFSSAQHVKLPAAVAGVCTEEDIDHYAVDVESGQALSLEIVGSRLGKGFDPVVTIYDVQRNERKSRDNDQGLFFDSRFEYRFPEAGRYVIAVHDSRYHGSANWSYLLRLGRFPAAHVVVPSSGAVGKEAALTFPQLNGEPRTLSIPSQYKNDQSFFFNLRQPQDDAAAWFHFAGSAFPQVLEAEPNEDGKQATVATVPADLHGIIRKAGDVDCFELQLKKGQRLEFQAKTRGVGSAADLELKLLSPKGKVVQKADDVGFDDAGFSFSVPSDGRYVLQVIEVVRQGGKSHVYRIEVRERRPLIELDAAPARLAIPQGSRQPLPLSVRRRDWAGPIELKLIGPSGDPPATIDKRIQLIDPVIPPDADEWTPELFVHPETPAGIYTVQLAGVGRKDDTEIVGFAKTRPLVDHIPTGRGPHGEPFELREDQRRLPPSLTDRIAILVLPPAPFDFQIETPVVVLPRYLTATFKLRTQRSDGFAEPITFVARGGTLEYERLRAPSVKATISQPPGEKSSMVTGELRSGVNTKLTRHRVTVTGTARQPDGRLIHLTRVFELDIRPAFALHAPKDRITCRPGESIKLPLQVKRLPPFAGDVQIAIDAIPGLQFPTRLLIPTGQDSGEVTLQVSEKMKPGQYKIKCAPSSRIGKFLEEPPAVTLSIQVQPAGEKGDATK